MMLFLAAVVLVNACGEFSITNFPSDSVCGQSFTLQWTYNSDATTYFTTAGNSQEVDIVLYKHVEALSDDVIAQLASVQYPTTSALISFPNPFPQAWLAASSDVNNNGSSFSATIYVQSADGSINSQNSHLFGEICSDDTFNLQCCSPAGAACQGSGVCGGNQTCNTGSGSPGSPSTPGSPTSGPGTQCQGPCGSSNTCTAAGCTTPYVPPGATSCICTPGTGTAPPTASAGETCTPGSVTNPAGLGSSGKPACSTSSSPLLACVNSVCAVCTTGTADCACSNTACTVNGYVCKSGRCVPNTGCSGCPCSSGLCNTGFVCIDGTCQVASTTAPTPSPPPPPPPCPLGSNGCSCAEQGNQVGCTVAGLVCKNGVCTAAAQRIGMALMAIVAAICASMI